MVVNDLDISASCEYELTFNITHALLSYGQGL